MAEFYERGGGNGDVDESNFDEIVEFLLEDLRTEEFETPDDEHTQASIANEHWSVTAQVSGLVSFENLDLILNKKKSDLPLKMHLCNIPDVELKKLWFAVVQENVEDLLSSNWVQLDQLPEYETDYYRK